MIGFFESAYRQLTPVERAFVDAYVSSVEEMAVRAHKPIKEALQAAPLPPDAKSQEILSSALVKAAIVDRVRELSESAELNVYRTLKELRNIAYSTVASIIRVREDGLFDFDLAKCTPEELSTIKSLSIKNGPHGPEIKITQHDKIAALDRVMKYQGLLESEHQHWKIVSASEETKTLTFESVDDAANAYAQMLDNND